MTAMTKTYTANAVRFGDWWAIDVPGINGLHTQARKLSNVESMARDAIAVALDVAPDTFAVVVTTELDDETLRLIKEAERTREEAALAQARAAAALAASVQHLRGRGLTVRDAGKLLGLSHQRVAQVLTSRVITKSAGSVSLKKATKRTRSDASSGPDRSRSTR